MPRIKKVSTEFRIGMKVWMKNFGYPDTYSNVVNKTAWVEGIVIDGSSKDAFTAQLYKSSSVNLLPYTVWSYCPHYHSCKTTLVSFTNPIGG